MRDLFGASGSDTLTGGAGTNYFKCGSGVRAFYFIAGTSGRAGTISGFSTAPDHLVRYGFASGADAAALAAATSSGAGTSVTLSDGTGNLLQGVGQLSAANFS